MELLQQLLPKFYNLAKSNPTFKVVAKHAYQKLSDINVMIRSFGKATTIYPPVERFWDSSKEWIQQTGTGAEGGSPVYQSLDAEHQLEKALPHTVDEAVHWKYRDHRVMEFPETFLLRIPKGRVAGQGFVMTPQNELLGDVSRVMDRSGHVREYTNHPQIHKKFPPVEHIQGRVATIAVPFAGTNYYHWMLDSLPRLDLIQRGGVDLNSIDYFLVSDYASTFQRDTLALLGIGKERILASQWHPHIQAEELIVPSLTCYTGEFPAWLCQWVANTFRPEKLAKPWRRLYLNRKKVSYRRVTNEPELEALLAERGFESIAPEGFTVLEQAKLLSEAEAVICPHGAGLTNIVFCQPGTKIVELLHHSAVNEMYWSISNAAGLNYSYLLSEGERPEEFVDPFENFVDISFSLREVAKLLDKLGVN